MGQRARVARTTPNSLSATAQLLQSHVQDTLELALATALEHVAAPVYVVDAARLEVHACNERARALLEFDRGRVLRCVEQRPRCSCGCSVLPLGTATGRARYLVLCRPEPVDCRHRVRIAAQRWGLTERQARVLSLVAVGLSNKEIAGTLQCAENTVEAHVTQLLSKAAAAQRSMLIFRFWSET